jgi:hypothetical protein
MNDQTNSHLPSSEVRRYAVNGAPQICRAQPESDFRTPQPPHKISSSPSVVLLAATQS